MEITQTNDLIKDWRNHYELNLELIRDGKHPNVYLLSLAEMNLVRDAMKETALSDPLVWESAMKTLKDIYWNNYKGYSKEISEIPQANKPLSYWGHLNIISYRRKTYPEILTLELKEAMIWNKELDKQPPNGSVIEVKVDERKRNGFGDWVCSLFGHTVKSIRKGSPEA